MPNNLNKYWMNEVSAGCSRVSPEISPKLYSEISLLPVSESLETVFRGDYLIKWRRSQPLTKESISDSDICDNPSKKSDGKIYSSQSRGRFHERFFWVSRICDTWFLRWHSRRKKSSESAFALCRLDCIRRGEEITYYDVDTPFDGIDGELIIVISGNISIQLAASSRRETLLWISGLFHVAKFARNEYVICWITNSEKINAFFNAAEQKGIPNFDSEYIAEELNSKSNSFSEVARSRKLLNAEEFFEWPGDLYGLVDLLKHLKLIGRPEYVEPIRSAVKRLIETRERCIGSLVSKLSSLDYYDTDNLVSLMYDSARCLDSLNIACLHLKDELILLDPWLTVSECKSLFYNIVRQYSLYITVSNDDNPDNELDNDKTDVCENFCEEDKGLLDVLEVKDYEKFLCNVQAANRMESGTNLLEITKNSAYPLAALRKREKKTKRPFCSLKSAKSSVPTKVLTVLGFHWSLSQKFNSICIPQDSEEIANLLRYPLGCFWVASSHNTYLLGDQLGGSATAGALADALLKGCRCIELDCQDGPENEPILFHSWKSCRLTGSVTLRDALMACKEVAFKNSKLPVILSFEMHCSDPFKAKTVEILREILKKSLFTPTEHDPSDIAAKVPLGCLLRRFLIKGKFKSSGKTPLDPGEIAWQSILSLRGCNISDVSPKSIEKINGSNVYAVSENKFYKLCKNEEDVRKLSDVCFLRVYPAATRLASTNFCPIKAWSLGVQFAALNYQSCDRSMLLNLGKFGQSVGYVVKPPELRSFSLGAEEELEYFFKGPIILRVHVLSASQLPPPKLSTFSQKNFASSLSNMFFSIRRGGKSLDMRNIAKRLNTGRNLDTGSSIDQDNEEITKLTKDDKLNHTRSEGLSIDQSDSGLSVEHTIDRSAKIMNNHKDITCPYVEVTVVGEQDKTQKTEAVNFNGYNPVWSDVSPPFEFFVKNPNQAILVLHVKHFDNLSTELVGQAAFPVNRIRPGIRWAQLLDAKFMEIECCGLLLHVEMRHAF